MRPPSTIVAGTRLALCIQPLREENLSIDLSGNLSLATQGEATTMSIWMLLVFAICMFSGVLSFEAKPELGSISLPLFLIAMAVFVVGLLLRGIRRPVV